MDRLRELVGGYFDLGYAEGAAGRDTDTIVGDAQRVLSDINAQIEAAESRALSLEEEVKRLRRLGDTLSNITFNLAQLSSPLTNDQKAVMREAVTQWDAGRQALSEGEQNG